MLRNEHEGLYVLKKTAFMGKNFKKFQKREYGVIVTISKNMI
jgi:hypothetical protein